MENPDSTSINTILQSIEEKHGVTALYAIEMGSRVWGWASPTSDHDLRFVYMRPAEAYFLVHPHDDTISHQSELESGIEVDAHGWDLLKFARLLSASNPAAIEWLNSPTIYREEWPTEIMRTLALTMYSPNKLYQHYYGMAFGHYRKYVTWPNDVWCDYRKYLHILRSLLMIESMRRSRSYPVLNICELMTQLEESESLQKEVAFFISSREAGSGYTVERDNLVIEQRCVELLEELREPSGFLLCQNIEGDATTTLSTMLSEVVSSVILHR